jgi:hypothetical protein
MRSTILKIIAVLLLIWAVLNVTFNPIPLYDAIWLLIAILCLAYVLRKRIITLVGLILMLVGYSIYTFTAHHVYLFFFTVGIGGVITLLGVIITIAGLVKGK